ncbi:hypothetical protein AB0M92_37190 [Streptomyces sp. NPDC051582]|uniref:hypothetical protein n=1 Tax=Streptomyces sp. NPDC051582 TaxID=3155167 RepID=UPI003431F26C
MIRRGARAAMYLRCYPDDIWQMSCHHDALLQLASREGLSPPAVFRDIGCRSRDPRPALDQLLALAGNSYQVVLVPGPFVFSIYDDEARAVVARLKAAGCGVLELPSRFRRGRGGARTRRQ